MGNKIVSYSTMTWFDFEKYAKKTPCAILPIGSEEQHGPHLPMSTDSYVAQHLANEISKKTQLMVLPRISYSTLFSLRKYPGTLYINEETFAHQLIDLASALSSHAIRYVYLVLGHHGAYNSCRAAERQLLSTNADINFVVLAFPGIDAAIHECCTSQRWKPGLFHAEEIETSMMLAIHPELVDMSKAVCEYPETDEYWGYISTYWNNICKSGVFGDATKGTAEKGKILLQAIIDKSTNIILNHMSSHLK